MSRFTAECLGAALVDVGVTPDEALFDKLRAAYGEPSRYYHTGEHIEACLSHLDDVRGFAEYPAEVEIALWFHDAVYDARRNDNEARSAAWAHDYLSCRGVNRGATRRISEMILATRGHASADGDTALLVDIDLSILGAVAETFETYDALIRREYAWVPEEDYRRGRAAVLRDFMDRPWIYVTAEFRRELEARARENLARKIAALDA